MQLAVIKKDKLEEMKSVLTESLMFYSNKDSRPYDFSEGDLERVGEVFDSANLPQLVVSQDGKPVYENCEKIHRFLRDKVHNHKYQSGKKGFWVYLTHAVFPDYTRLRFTPSDDPTKFVNQIKRYWFMGEQDFSNAICGLYLICELPMRFQDEPVIVNYLQKNSYEANDYARFICTIPDYKMIFQHRATRSSLLLFAILEALRLATVNSSDDFIFNPDSGFGKYHIKHIMARLSLILPGRNLQMLELEPLIGIVTNIILAVKELKNLK